MKTLKFKNGKTFDFRDTSTINTLVFDATTFATLDAIKTEFEKADNLIGGVFDGENISETVYTGAQVELAADGAIVARFTTRAYTNDEIVNQRLSDLEDTVAELI
jgi:hypothetical protein